tara:strand:- start:2593 stop:3045 length:453 start_codon:yes stop_codon:yes gene_type:complete
MADMGGFDASKVEDSKFEAVPAGEYRVIMTESEKKKTKDGASELLQVKLQILDGPYKNRTVIDRFNLWNKNPEATKIADQQFKKVCVAVGVMVPKDSSQLHGKPMMAKLSVREYNGNDQNEVKGYKACLPGSQPAATTSATTSAPSGWTK